MLLHPKRLVLLLAVTLCLTAHAQAPTTAPVIVGGQPIFTVRNILSFPARDRATIITGRIDHLTKDLALNPQTISVTDKEQTTEIADADLLLMSVTDSDATGTGESRHDLAVDYAHRISVAVLAVRKQYSARSLTLGAIYALLATIALFIVFRLLRLIFPWIYAKINSWRGTRIPSFRIQNYEFLTSDRIADLLLGFVRLVRLAADLLVIYVYLSLVLGFFPWTRGYARVLLGYVISPLKIVASTIIAWLPNLFFIAVILFVAYYFTKFTRVIFDEIGKGNITFTGFHPDWAEPTYKIARFMILAITAIAVFPYLPGSKSPAFQGISIFLGVLFSLGSTSAIANIIAGVILTYMRAFRLGDRVQIADTIGDVVEVSLLVTRIRTIKNVEITIANSMVLSSHIINFSNSVQQGGLILNTEVTIGYDAPWRQVHELLLSAAAATPRLLTDPKPFVYQTALDDFYVHYQINAFTDHPSGMAATYSALHQNIQDKFNEAGVEIMSPHFSGIRDGNRIAIPDKYIPSDYTTPTFHLGLDKTPTEKPRS